MTVYFYALFVHLSFNVYIFLKGVRLLEEKRVWRAIFASFFILEFVLYLIGLYFQSVLPANIVRFLWLMGSTWMVFIFYMTLMWFFIDLMFYLNYRKPFMGNYLSDNPRTSGAIFFAVTILSIVIIMYMGSYRFRNPVVTELELNINKDAGNLSSLRIAVVSDLHLGYLINKK